MAQMAQKVFSGNTEQKKRKRSKNWMVTINNPTEEDLLGFEKVQNYVYQFEEGEEKGTLHIQGYIEFPSAKDFSVVKSTFPRANIKKRAGTKRQAIDYCSKLDTRVKGPYSKNLHIKEEIKSKITRFYNWQQDILNITKEDPEDRKIYWIFDINGNTGKTEFCKYLVDNKGAAFVTGKGTNIKYVLSILNESQNLNLILFHFTRSYENYVSYDAIESVKDGIFFSEKYECKTIRINTPHIFCFSNFPPNIEKLSLDRWNVFIIENLSLRQLSNSETQVFYQRM